MLHQHNSGSPVWREHKSFGETIWASITLPLKTKLPLKARYNHQLQPAIWQPAGVEKHKNSAAYRPRISSHCQSSCKLLKEADSFFWTLPKASTLLSTYIKSSPKTPKASLFNWNTWWQCQDKNRAVFPTSEHYQPKAIPLLKGILEDRQIPLAVELNIRKEARHSHCQGCQLSLPMDSQDLTVQHQQSPPVGHAYSAATRSLK